MRFLVDELEKEEELIKPGRSYPVWSPYRATDAAANMLEVLRSEEYFEVGPKRQQDEYT